MRLNQVKIQELVFFYWRNSFLKNVFTEKAVKQSYTGMQAKWIIGRVYCNDIRKTINLILFSIWVKKQSQVREGTIDI